ncbi:MAG: Entericidin EcnA/B family [Pseudomonadota bacterium]|jgi:predicted small secreted protein
MLKYIAIALCALSLCACNTVAGIGKDIQSGGHAIQNAAQ